VTFRLFPNAPCFGLIGDQTLHFILINVPPLAEPTRRMPDMPGKFDTLCALRVPRQRGQGVELLMRL
jgi:hypothetical protein